MVRDIVHPGAKHEASLHEYTCTSSLEFLVAECMAVVDINTLVYLSCVYSKHSL